MRRSSACSRLLAGYQYRNAIYACAEPVRRPSYRQVSIIRLGEEASICSTADTNESWQARRMFIISNRVFNGESVYAVAAELAIPTARAAFISSVREKGW